MKAVLWRWLGTVMRGGLGEVPLQIMGSPLSPPSLENQRKIKNQKRKVHKNAKGVKAKNRKGMERKAGESTPSRRKGIETRSQHLRNY